jgi:parallel beta-helix repeat protein
MIRKWLAVGIILLFVGTGIFPVMAHNTEKTLPISRGNWLYVGGSGPGNYTRIQDAVDNASDGDTVFVYQGVYTEDQITIYKKVHLIGEDRNNTIIDGLGRYDGIHAGKGASIRSFTIQRFSDNYYSAGIYIDANNISISNNIIKSCTRGICFTSKNCIDIEISNNIISNNIDYGILLEGKACSIHDNYFTSNPMIGLRVSGSTRFVSIDHNQFKNNFQGIYAESTRATITYNNFYNNDYHVSLFWRTRLMNLPLVLYRRPLFYGNYWDNWGIDRPHVIQGYFTFWVYLPPWDPMVYGVLFHFKIVQFDWKPAQIPNDIGG